jgi:hypothetical protein
LPKKSKAIPENRAEWSFGEAVFWHFFVFGTRPTGKPTDKVGRIWGPKDAAKALGISVRGFWNWVDDSHLPYDTTALERALFDKSPLFDAWRIELQRTLRETRDGKARKPEPPPEYKTGRSLVPVVTGQAVTLYHSPEYDDDTVFGSENFGKDHANRAGGGKIALLPPILAYVVTTVQNRPLARKGTAVVAGITLLLGVVTSARLFNSNDPPQPKQETSTPITPLPQMPTSTVAPPVSPPPVQPASRPLTEQEQRAAEDRRIQERGIAARQAAFDADLKRKNDEAIRLDREAADAAKAQRDREGTGRSLAGLGFTVRENNTVSGHSIGYVLAETLADCAIACMKDGCEAFAYRFTDAIGPNSRGRACYRYKAPFTLSANPSYTAGERLKEPAPAMATAPPPTLSAPPIKQAAQPAANTQAPTSADGVVQCASGPVKVTGFKISCDRILSGGTTLGSAQLSYTVANINECAAKCRPISRCVGFTFNGADPPGRQACTLFGPTPEGRQSSGWIAAVR